MKYHKNAKDEGHKCFLEALIQAKNGQCKLLEKFIKGNTLDDYHFKHFLKHLESLTNQQSENATKFASTIAKAIERDKAYCDTILILKVGTLILEHDIPLTILPGLISELRWIQSEGLGGERYPEEDLLWKSLLKLFNNIIQTIENVQEADEHCDIAETIVHYFADRSPMRNTSQDYKKLEQAAIKLLLHVRSDKRKTGDGMVWSILRLAVACIKQSLTKSIPQRMLEVLEAFDFHELNPPAWSDTDDDMEPLEFDVEDCKKLGKLLSKQEIVIGSNMDIIKAKFQIEYGNRDPQMVIDVAKILIKILNMPEDPEELAVTPTRMQLTKKSAIQCLCAITKLAFNKFGSFNAKVTSGIEVLDDAMLVLARMLTEYHYCHTASKHLPHWNKIADNAVYNILKAETLTYGVRQALSYQEMLSFSGFQYLSSYRAEKQVRSLFNMLVSKNPPDLPAILTECLYRALNLLQTLKQPHVPVTRDVPELLRLAGLAVLENLAANQQQPEVLKSHLPKELLTRLEVLQANKAYILQGMRQAAKGTVSDLQYHITPQMKLPTTLLKKLAEVPTNMLEEFGSEDSLSSLDDSDDD